MKIAVLAAGCALILSGVSADARACGTVKMYSGMYFASDDPTAKVLALKRLMCVTPLRVQFRERKQKEMLALVLRDAMFHPLSTVRAEAQRVYCRYAKSEGRSSKLKSLLSRYFGRPHGQPDPPLFDKDERAIISRLGAEGTERYFKRRKLAALVFAGPRHEQTAGLLRLRGADGGEYEVLETGKVRAEPEVGWPEEARKSCSVRASRTLKLRVKDPAGKLTDYSIGLDHKDLQAPLLFERISAQQPKPKVTPALAPARANP